MSHDDSKRPEASLITPHKPRGLHYEKGKAAGGGTPPPPPPRPPRSSSGWGSKFFWFTLAAMLLAAAALLAHKARPRPMVVSAPPKKTASLQALPAPRAFPDQDTVELESGRWVTAYAPDRELEARSLRYLDQYHPEGAVVAICDLRTGMIRALAERDSGRTTSQPRLALGTTFPAASLAKIITASAAIEQGLCRPTDDLPMLGRAHTLYRSQLRVPANGRYPKVSLELAFARSINPVFGLLGLRTGAGRLRIMAGRLGFNQSASESSDAPAGRYAPPDSGYELAEVACGFTTATTISPLHALQIARAIGRDGRMQPVRFTSELHAVDGDKVLELPSPPPSDPFLSAPDLNSLRSLMEATISSGTARKGFRRNLNAEEFRRLDMGGKTGSLNGENPRGRYEWFIGYARRRDNPDEGIAVAVMLINRTYLAVHATELAGLVIRDWWRYSDRAADSPYLAKR